MKSNGSLRVGFSWVLIFLLPTIAWSQPINHQIDVQLDPQNRSLSVVDTVTLPSGSTFSEFTLHGGLTVEAAQPAVALAGEGTDHGVPWRRYRLSAKPVDGKLGLTYRGEIFHGLSGDASADASAIVDSAGVISAEGVFLASSSLWYPQFDSRFVTFDMKVTVPKGWQAVSQGARVKSEEGDQTTLIQWSEAAPQDDIYLLGGPMMLYQKISPAVDAQVYLRSADAELAQSYLEATEQFVTFYSELLGPYPYKKFALVENFWETGFGMPSFTALGSQVIRLPFIIFVSYPHEILHNWWGNGVYVDYSQGNWAEGLTAYLADHLLKEQRGQGADDRRGALQKYADYVKGGRDFALRQFQSRHSSASEAIGYGKALMVFHMLRMRVGDEAFVKGLREFYSKYKFSTAGWTELIQAFALVADDPGLKSFMAQWIDRPGAPELQLAAADVRQSSEGHMLSLTLAQNQASAPYELIVPVAVTLAGESEARIEWASLNGASQKYEFTFAATPLRVDVDPDFDVFRRLHAQEIPPALSQGFGAEKAAVILPPKSDPLYAAWRSLAEAWRDGAEGQWALREADASNDLPADAAVWFFGSAPQVVAEWQTAFGQSPYGVRNGELVVPEGRYAQASHAFMVALRRPPAESQTMLWLSAPNAEAIAGLGRKLPHYRRYSYLVFEAQAMQNIAKGQWPVMDSPLSHRFDADASMLVLPKRAPLGPL